MKTCPNCKNTVNDNELFCPNCGTRVDAQQTPDMNTGYQANPQYTNTQPDYTQQNNQYTQQDYSQQNYGQPGGYYPPQQPANQGLNTTPYLVWSIINILLCCMPLGIWSLILSINANKKPTYEQAQKDIKTAKTLCLISTIGGAVFQIFYIIFFVIGSMAGSGMI